MSTKYLEIRFLSVGCGDGIRIRFLGNDSLYHNIIIDGGTYKGRIYENTIKQEIQSIIDNKERIDLWIITHIDDDHIGGILRLIKDTDLLMKTNLRDTTFWFNYSNLDYDTGIKNSNLKSVSQGIKLREFLNQNSNLIESITDSVNPISFFGAKLIILSPDNIRYQKLMKLWKNEEIKIIKKQPSKLKSASGGSDYACKVNDFKLDEYSEDDSPENASSIAFIFEYNDMKYLFTADSIPSVLVNSLSNLGYTNGNKLKLNLMQMPHHGNKRNLNDDLLKIIDCRDFVISADAYNNHNLPNKEAIARVLKSNANQSIRFYITHKNTLTESIFKVDENLKNSTLIFPALGSNSLIFNYV